MSEKKRSIGKRSGPADDIVYRARYTLDVELQESDLLALLQGRLHDLPLSASKLDVNVDRAINVTPEVEAATMPFQLDRPKLEEFFRFVLYSHATLELSALGQGYDISETTEKRNNLIQELTVKFRSLARSATARITSSKKRERSRSKERGAFMAKLWENVWEWTLTGATTKKSFIEHYYGLSEDDLNRSNDSLYYRRFDAEMKRYEISQAHLFGMAAAWRQAYGPKASPQDSDIFGAESYEKM